MAYAGVVRRLFVTALIVSSCAEGVGRLGERCNAHSLCEPGLRCHEGGCVSEGPAGGALTLDEALAILDGRDCKGSCVEVQFDPLHPVPVRGTVATPTGLMQAPDGTLTRRVYPCEGRTSDQCLDGRTGWPGTTPVTLYFSGSLDMSTVADGVRWICQDGTDLVDVPFNATVVSPRPVPPAACKAGDNGSAPARTYTTDVSGVAVILTPTVPVPGGQACLLAVRSGAQDGLRTADGGAVRPSFLFERLRGTSRPTSDPAGPRPVAITEAVLRQVVEAIVRDGLGLAIGEVSAAFEEEVSARAMALAASYAHFEAAIARLTQAGLVSSRDDLIWVDAWTTETIAPVVHATGDWAPFPSIETHTATTGPALEDIRVSLPLEGAAASLVPTLQGINATRDGFSTVAPIMIFTSSQAQAASLAGRVVMYPLDTAGAIAGPAVSLRVSSEPATSDGPPAIVIRPTTAFDEATTYVVALLRGIQATSGAALAPSQTYGLLRRDSPIIDAAGSIDPPVRRTLECSELEVTGALPSDSLVIARANALEHGLGRARWQAGLIALEGTAPPTPREDVLLAFTYRTQSVSAWRWLMQGPLLEVWASIAAAAGTQPVAGPVTTVTGRAAITSLLGVVDSTCLPLCQLGVMEPAVARSECQNPMGGAEPAVESHALCQSVLQVYAGDLAEARIYLVALHELRAGNPYTSGTFDPRHYNPLSPDFIPPAPTVVPAWVAVPTGTGPFPVAIAGPGLARSKEDMLFVANALAAEGLAMVAIDWPFHGARASDLINNTTGAICTDVSPSNVVCDPATGTCSGGCDDRQDPSGTGFITANAFATGDNLRQATVDIATLVWILQREGAPAGALDMLDGTSITYVGQSLGALVGGVVAPLVVGLPAVALNAPTGALADTLLGSVPAVSGPLYESMIASGQCNPIDAPNPAMGCLDDQLFRRSRVLLQWILDLADPLALAASGSTSHVLLQRALPDQVFAPASAERLARAYGLDSTDNGVNSRVQTFDFSAGGATNCHGFLLGPCAGDTGTVLDAFCASAGAQSQAAGWLAAGAATVPSRVPMLDGIVCQ